MLNFVDSGDAAHDLDETLGGRIVYAREAQGLTTAELALRLGIKTETLQSWETDRAEPRSNRLITLAGMINVSPTWLLVGAGPSPDDALSASDVAALSQSVARLRKQVEAIVDELDRLDECLKRAEN